MKIKYLFVVVFLVPLYTLCQSKYVQPLNVADTVPDVLFSQVLNAKFGSARLSNFKSKLLLIDFWTIYCSPCIKEFSRLEKLKREFNKDINFLLIHKVKSDMDYDKVNRFLKKYKKDINSGFSIPTITGDSVMERLFPHERIPHFIWLDENRKVRAITNQYAVNTGNIQSMLKDPEFSLLQKKDILYDASKSLFENSASLESVKWKSLIAGFQPGIVALKYVKIRDSITERHTLINVPILFIYRQIFNFLPHIDNRYIIESKKRDLLIDKKEDGFNPENLITYELTTPLNVKKKDVSQKMLSDINNYLGLQVTVEKRDVSCWAIVIGDSSKILKAVSRQSYREMDEYDRTKSDSKYFGTTVQGLLYRINHQVLGKPLVPIVVDETGYEEKIDFKISTDNIHDMQALKKDLLRNGFDLVPVIRKLDMLVIKDDPEVSKNIFYNPNVY